MKYDSVNERKKHCDELRHALLPALRHAARCCGYALAVHGSLSRDIDLIAAPWRESAIDAANLIDHLHRICFAVTGVDSITQPTEKPCGRVAWAIHLTHYGGDGPYLDISVMPVRTSDAEAK